MNISANVLSTGNVMVPLAQIPTDDGGQTRVNVRAAVVRDYAAAMTGQLAEGGLRFPPVILFTDGQNYWLGDGFHRILAARQAGLTEFPAEVRPGSQRDALLVGICANSDHGLPRTNADKRKAAALVLADAEWSQWSDREIARRCRLSNWFVSRARRGASVKNSQIERKVHRGGAVYAMNVNPRGATGEARETLPATPAAAPATDALGIPLPEPRASAFAGLGDFHEAHDLLGRLAALLDRISKGPSGELLRPEMIWTDTKVGFACASLRACRNKLLAAEPYCSYCPNCHPTHPERAYPYCRKCGGRGWTTRAAFDSCAESGRQHVLSMRTPPRTEDAQELVRQ